MRLKKALKNLIDDSNYYVVVTSNGIMLFGDKEDIKKGIKKLFKNIKKTELKLSDEELEELLEDIKNGKWN